MVDRLARPGSSVAPLGQGEIEAGPGRRSLTEQVYDALKREILTARLRPSQPLIENELAARFGVSKTPIREALRLLVQDGWIVVLPRKGYLVAPLSLEDVREVFALRLLLELQVTGEAASQARPWRRGCARPTRSPRARTAASRPPCARRAPST